MAMFTYGLKIRFVIEATLIERNDVILMYCYTSASGEVEHA